MKVLRYIPVILSFLMLAAHFSRYNMQILVIICLIIPFLLFIKKRFVVRIIQVILILGAVEWVLVMLDYVDIRKNNGQDWTRLAIILSSVALFTLLSALIFETKAMKRIYKTKKQS